jgi:pimeloyl-ACP methyl ester carboxylesterase
MPPDLTRPVANETPTAAAPQPGLPELRIIEVPPEARSRFAGDRLSYMEAGAADAPAVLLLHGIGANSFYWRFLYEGLSPRYRVVAWNAPGYVLTDPLLNKSPACEDYVDALDAFTKAVNLPQKFSLVGNSFGSAVAQCYTVKYPERIRRLALSGTSVGAKTTPPEEREATFARRQKQFERGGGFNYAREILDVVTGSRTTALAKSQALDVLAMTDARGYLQASHVPYSFDAFELAARIECPVLIYHGTEDKIAPIERSSIALAKLLRNVRLETFEGYGHLPDIELPRQVVDLLLNFLDGP